MSRVPSLLRDKASELMAQADTLEQSVDWSITKQAALSTLIEGGMDESEANSILAGLEAQAVPNRAEVLEKVAGFRNEASIFNTTAEYIDEIESKLLNSESRVEELEKTASASHVFDEFKEKGFTDAEIEELKSLPGDTLMKVASSFDQAPWGVGSVADRVSASTDPMLAFLTN